MSGNGTWPAGQTTPYLVSGERYRVILTGTANEFGDLIADGGEVATYLTDDELNAADVEHLPAPVPPAPTAPTSIVLDRDGNAWQLWSEGVWASANRIYGPLNETDLYNQHGPLTVLLDAGAPL